MKPLALPAVALALAAASQVLYACAVPFMDSARGGDDNVHLMVHRTAEVAPIAERGLASPQTKAEIIRQMKQFGFSDAVAVRAAEVGVSPKAILNLKSLNSGGFSDDFYLEIINRGLVMSAEQVAELLQLKSEGFSEALIVSTLPEGTAAASSVGPSAKGKVVIVVLDFENQTGLPNVSLGPGIADMVTTALLGTGRFRVVERGAAFKKIIEEQNLQLTGATSPESAVRIGRVMGASYVLTGKVTEFGIRKTTASIGFILGGGGKKKITSRVVMDGRLVSVETAEVVAAAYGEAESSTEVEAGYALPISFEVGTEGFDETTIGQATRRAAEQMVEKLSTY